MITITRVNDNFIFEVRGVHKLWTLKSELTIPVDHVINAHQDMEVLKGWKGWRSPGISIPSFITAGTFHKDDSKIFWDVTMIENCIVIDLKDEDYTQLILEVENPDETMALLKNR